MIMTTENLELSVTRLIGAPVAMVWKIAIERMEEWWCPKPWTVEIIEQDWRVKQRAKLSRFWSAPLPVALDGCHKWCFGSADTA